MLVLNLGCGSRTSPLCVNIDWSPYLRLRRSPAGSTIARLILRGQRRERFEALADDVVVHDLRRPLPFADGSADAVYHSHVLEHLDRAHVGKFLSELHRVLRAGGVQRVVVPDFEASCRRYIAHVDLCGDHPEMAPEHDNYVGAIVEQMVRREATGTSTQKPLWRLVENALLGDARRRGETHQWMYDRVNLSEVLREAGFRDVSVVDYRTSMIPAWHDIHLDQLENGEEYIRGSLYIEAFK